MLDDTDSVEGSDFIRKLKTFFQIFFSFKMIVLCIRVRRTSDVDCTSPVTWRQGRRLNIWSKVLKTKTSFDHKTRVSLQGCNDLDFIITNEFNNKRITYDSNTIENIRMFINLTFHNFIKSCPPVTIWPGAQISKIWTNAQITTD